ncbi:MAG: PSD1 and planctomycete cytochrome C domain-containing protein [Terriglobales bacterium]
MKRTQTLGAARNVALLCGLAVGVSGPFWAAPEPAKPARVAFRTQIEPIFKTSCVQCHAGARGAGNLKLDDRRAALAGGASGKAIVPGHGAQSLLVEKLLGLADGARMPMGMNPLPKAQVDLIQTWIDQGADWPEDAPAPQATSTEFETVVQPLLAANCVRCHGPEVQQNRLRLDSYAGVMKGALSGAVVIPGKAASSPLVRRLLGQDEPRMPFQGAPLPAATIVKIQDWINHGAEGPAGAARAVAAEAKHWSYVKPVRPALPAVKNAAWARNPIDRFVLARLEKEGLEPSPEASRETLMRRVSLDLTGLPPTLAEIDAFVNDRSPHAYQKVVDRLFASPHYGERWARPWLDLARYADTNGYEKDLRRTAWKYRDWVIDALNRDMPFNEFTIEQIAGDMLPHPTLDQEIATGFHRNTLLNQEGGTDPEEQRFYTLVDRVNTTASVWLGTTLGCAQCHNHKYDPFSQKDYYRMMAFFDNAEYKVVGHGEHFIQEPTVELPTPAQATECAAIKKEIAGLEAVLAQPTPQLAAQQSDWETGLQHLASQWTVLQPTHVVSLGGASLTVAADGSVLASGKNPEADTYEVEARVSSGTPGPLTALRLEVLPDPGLPQGGPGRDNEGNFFLSGVQAEVAPPGATGAWKKIVFKTATANDSQDGYGVGAVISDGSAEAGWAIDTSKGHAARQAVLIAAAPVGLVAGTRLRVRLLHAMPHASRNIGRFRLAITSAAAPARGAQVPVELQPVLDMAAGKRSAEQAEQLAAFYRTIAPTLDATRSELATRQKALSDLGIATAMIERERPGFERPSTFLRVRGGYLTPGERVYAGTPAALPPLPPDVLPNRLGLAYWLVDEDNPLVARVTVNRFWEQIFGRGIVETAEDFGSQGSRPSHPELLDWLAVEFMHPTAPKADGKPASAWSMKAIQRLMVTSATYRQVAAATPKLLERDPYNVMLARGPRFRMEAEMIRDSSLAIGGLLSPKIGGPSVFPPQPDGVWDIPYNADRWVTSPGEDRYRRGLYTFIRRSAPYPSMVTFDAPSREFCTVRRVRTNTPLQALTTLNDPAFFEAARGLAQRMVREGGTTPEERVSYGFRLSTARLPQAPERTALVAFYRQQLGEFQENPAAARRLLHLPAVTAVQTANPSAPPASAAELAAWTMVGNVLLNMDETLTKE